MAHELTLPDLGEGLVEGEVSRWLVAEGETVVRGAPLVEIQTDKRPRRHRPGSPRPARAPRVARSLREHPARILMTPLINHPEVAILGVHRVAPRPVVRDGEVVVREIGNASVTFDHRVVDGLQAASFCLDVVARLQDRRGPPLQSR